MKLIELLNKIANGESVPKKIKFDREEFEWDTIERYYKRDNGDDLLELCITFSTEEFMNINVEVIEDKTNTIEELTNEAKGTAGEFNTIKNKINELVRAVNQLNEKED